MDSPTRAREAERSLHRLLPRLDAGFSHTPEWSGFVARLETHFPALFVPLLDLYGGRYDFFYHLERIVEMAAAMWSARIPALRSLDVVREQDPNWFQSQRMVGAVCYVDRFAGDLAGLTQRIPYLRDLGVTYLHLMPVFLSPPWKNDGGYAVSDYQTVEPRLGTTADLSDLAGHLRAEGISLVLDFVLNHTSDEHRWAVAARSGDPDYQEFYLTFADRTMPEQFQRTVREIFPEVRPGSFTYNPEMQRWVWTTFNSFQWDLNYANPSVFTAMAEQMLFLANQGAEILRFDAPAFVWKQMGTASESLPQAHTLIRAFNAVARIAAPALLFKSEAIVHPDEVLRYISSDECRLSYNPMLMALLWESLATRETRLLELAVRERMQIPPDCAWVNYVRSHDDIGWTFDDGDAARLGINGFDHRQFLNAFYTGRFPGSFARGVPFQENPRTGDARVSGTAASLAGLERAIETHDTHELDLSIARILLLYGIVFSIGGIPLLYLGDEIGTLNDPGYADDPFHADDNRWVHRPVTDWHRVERRRLPGSIEYRLHVGMRRLSDTRRACPALAGHDLTVIEPGNGHVFGYVRRSNGEQVVVLANFSEHMQRVGRNAVAVHGAAGALRDLLSEQRFDAGDEIRLEPYQLVWLAGL